jgi:hypothetical protein
MNEYKHIIMLCRNIINEADDLSNNNTISKIDIKPIKDMADKIEKIAVDLWLESDTK